MRLLALLGLAFLGLGCTGSDTAQKQGAPAPAQGDAGAENGAPLVVYCGRKEALVGPLLNRFQEETGIELDIRYNTTPSLAAMLAAEGEETPCDVFYGQESGYLGALAGRGLLRELPTALSEAVQPAFRAPDGHWLGISGRLRVLVYHQSEFDPADLPDTLAGLADPRWKGRIGWAPSNASFQAHVSLLRHTWGEERTRDWLIAVRDNGARVYPKNSPQVLAADSGEIALGWVNHYYLHKLADQAPDAANYSFPAEGRLGNVMMVSGAGITVASARPERAQRLLEYLIAAPAQTFLAEEGYEYPVIADVALHEGVTPLDEIPLAEVDQQHLTDITATLKLLREVGLQ